MISTLIYIAVSVVFVFFLFDRLRTLKLQCHEIKNEVCKLERILPILEMIPLSEQAKKIYYLMEDREEIYKETKNIYYKLELKEMETFSKKNNKMDQPFIPSDKIISLRKELAEECCLRDASQKLPRIYQQMFVSIMSGNVSLIEAENELNKLLPPLPSAFIADKNSVNKLLEEWSLTWDKVELEKRLAMTKEILQKSI